MGFHRSSESALGRVLWVTERDVAFDAPLLKPGGNVIALTKHARAWTDGVLYDYLRLELDPQKAFTPRFETKRTTRWTPACRIKKR